MDYPTLSEQLIKKGNEIRNDLVRIRRWLHQHPELSSREYETSDFIAGKLEQLGLEPERGLAKTGLSVLLQGGK